MIAIFVLKVQLRRKRKRIYSGFASDMRVEHKLCKYVFASGRP
jgi:hypothetical protein